MTRVVRMLAAILSLLPVAGQAQRVLTTAVPIASDSLLARAVTTASGLRYAIRQAGTGTPPQPGDRVAVHYTGLLAADGRIFDTSVQQGGPLKVKAGRGTVIKGFDEALLLLPAGSRARIWIPAALAYGPKGRLDPDDETEKRYLIPPNADLIFELEIIRVR